MTQKRKLVSKLFVAVVVLTLVSCCFLASTFARYTSGGSGTGTVNVATWKITGKGTGDAGGINATFDKLSPSKDAYVDTPRTHSTAPVLVATISNTGDVDALVTLTTGASTITEPAGGWEPYTESAIEGLFTIKLYTSTEEEVSPAVGDLTAYTVAINVPATSGTLYVYAVVTWTSDDKTVTGEAADTRDTWVGENVTGVSFDISYTAVQNSEAPNA